MNFKFKIVVVPLVAVSLVTGCVTTSQVGTFSQAATQAVAQVGNGFNEVQETTVTRKMSSIASGTEKPTDKTFEGLLDQQKELAPCLNYLTELQKYSQSLGGLANADYRTQIDNASANLNGSLKGLATTYQSATSQTLSGAQANDIQILSTIVDAIGNAIVEAKRQEALRSIIIKTDPAVQTACNDLLSRLKLLGDNHFVYQNLDSVVADLVNQYNLDTGNWSYDQRMHQLLLIQQARLVRDGSDTFLASAEQSITALAKAHSALADAAKQGVLSNKAIIDEVSDLSNQATEAKKFYDRIHNSN